jgi:hypothetical protein
MKRKTIPKTLKNQVWDKYIGQEKGLGKCYCCSKTIDSKNFECGHVRAVKKGGTNTLNNLRPICGCCNKSMGVEDLEVFKENYFPNSLNKIRKYLDKIDFFINIIQNIYD